MKSKILIANLILILSLILPVGSQNLSTAIASSPNYSISGRVTDSSGIGVQGVTVTALASWKALVFLPVVTNNAPVQAVGISGLIELNNQADLAQGLEPLVLDESLQFVLPFSTVTDANGDYMFMNLPAANYLVTPSQSGSIFSPVSRQVTLPPDAATLDFTRPAITPSEMISIPAGTFHRGCDSNHNGGLKCAADELPLRDIYLDAYKIDKYEVTNAQYAQCVVVGACTAPASNSSATRQSYFDNPTYADYPVIWVTWNNASNYCQWVGKRLPTEAEWEKAARGSVDTRAYPWGDAAPSCSLTNSWNDATSSTCVGDTTLAGFYPSGASPYGVLDIAGNAWEWVNDWYQSGYYSTAPSSNPPGPTSGTYKTLRGGDWYGGWLYLRVADRDGYNPSFKASYVGFRCAAAP